MRETEAGVGRATEIERVMREEGYYWVKQGGNWGILIWDGTQWTNNDCYYDGKDVDFEEIDENRITRDIVVSGDFTLKGGSILL